MIVLGDKSHIELTLSASQRIDWDAHAVDTRPGQSPIVSGSSGTVATAGTVIAVGPGPTGYTRTVRRLTVTNKGAASCTVGAVKSVSGATVAIGPSPALAAGEVLELADSGWRVLDATGAVKSSGGGGGGGGSGETNTATSVNVDGVGIVDGKVGVDLQFRGIASADGTITVALDGANKTVDVSVGTVPAGQVSGLATVATTGAAADVTGLAVVATSGLASSLAGLAAVALSGAAADLSGLAPIATSGSAGDLTGLSPVATSGSAADLSAGTLLAARMPAHTGDATSSAGSVALTIPNDTVTNAKAANMAASTIKGNNTGGVADPADLTVAQVKTLLAYTAADISAVPTTRTVTASAPITGGGALSGNISVGFDAAAALDNNARVAVSKNSGATVATRRRLNLIEGANVTITVADDAGNEETDITIAASGGGGGSGLTHAEVLVRLGYGGL